MPRGEIASPCRAGLGGERKTKTEARPSVEFMPLVGTWVLRMAAHILDD